MITRQQHLTTIVGHENDKTKGKKKRIGNLISVCIFNDLKHDDDLNHWLTELTKIKPQKSKCCCLTTTLLYNPNRLEQ